MASFAETGLLSFPRDRPPGGWLLRATSDVASRCAYGWKGRFGSKLTDRPPIKEGRSTFDSGHSWDAGSSVHDCAAVSVFD